MSRVSTGGRRAPRRAARRWVRALPAALVAFGLLCGGCSSARVRPEEVEEEAPAGDGCPAPEVALNGRPVPGAAEATHYRSRVAEVRFPAEMGPLAERRVCKLKCVGGAWTGPLCQTKPGGRFRPLLRHCKLENTMPQLMFSVKNITVYAGQVFPHSTELQARCRELGVYKLQGDANVTCVNGAWRGRMPSCIPTTMLTNFTEDSPPTVLVKVPSGSASVEPSGALAVFPGSILHLECLFSRRLGNPEWTWTSTFRQYLTGWAIAAEEREWKYRLSIYYSKPQDSGVFTCASPRGLTNSVTIHVAAVHCAPFEPSDPFLTTRVEGSRLGHVAVFQCPIGFRLNGTSNLTCQASGKWSGEPPRCQPIVCPPIVVDDPRLSLVEHNTSYGGRAVFRCAWGHLLIGNPGVECEVDGSWSGRPPLCQVVECPAPVAPEHGHLVLESPPPAPAPPPPPPSSRRDHSHGHGHGHGRSRDRTGAYGYGYSGYSSYGGSRGGHRVGTAVRFSCRENHQLIGESAIVCTETGHWSHPPPLCKARCPYPGDPAHGRVSPLKFAYEPGDQVAVTCAAGFVSRVDERLRCRSDGSWSRALPACTAYQDV